MVEPIGGRSGVPRGVQVFAVEHAQGPGSGTPHDQLRGDPHDLVAHSAQQLLIGDAGGRDVAVFPETKLLVPGNRSTSSPASRDFCCSASLTVPMP